MSYADRAERTQAEAEAELLEWAHTRVTFGVACAANCLRTTTTEAQIVLDALVEQGVIRSWLNGPDYVAVKKT